MYRILLIDDASEDNFLHARTLRKHFEGCTVELAEHGERGLELLAEMSPEGVDLILLDVNMPVMDAWGFLERYGALTEPERARRLLLMLSVPLPSADHERVLAYADIHATLTKPLNAAEIASLMEGNGLGS